MLPSAAKPFTAKTARSVLDRVDVSSAHTTTKNSTAGEGATRVLYVQSEDFRCVSGLYTVALALSGISRNHSKVCAGDSEYRSAVFAVRVELSLLGVCNGDHVGHRTK